MQKYKIENIKKDVLRVLPPVKYMVSTIYTKEGEPCGHFSHRTNFSIKIDSKLLQVCKEIENTIGLSDYVLSRFINLMQTGDYINTFSKQSGRYYISKMLLYTPTGGKIYVNGEKISLQEEQALTIPCDSTYSVPCCNKRQLAMVWLVPYWLDITTLQGVSNVN